jgi:hypothetical protein
LPYFCYTTSTFQQKASDVNSRKIGAAALCVGSGIMTTNAAVDEPLLDTFDIIVLGAVLVATLAYFIHNKRQNNQNGFVKVCDQIVIPICLFCVDSSSAFHTIESVIL